MYRFILVLCVVTAISHSPGQAQNTSQTATKEEVTDVKNSIDGINSPADARKKIKISGNIQAQYQIADSAGNSPFAESDFPANVGSRFSAYRGHF